MIMMHIYPATPGESKTHQNDLPLIQGKLSTLVYPLKTLLVMNFGYQRHSDYTTPYTTKIDALCIVMNFFIYLIKAICNWCHRGSSVGLYLVINVLFTSFICETQQTNVLIVGDFSSSDYSCASGSSYFWDCHFVSTFCSGRFYYNTYK